MTTPTLSKPGLSGEQISALTMSTLAFAVNFAVWVMFSVIGIKIKAELNLNETEFGLLVATPILTGSLVRLPLGILTDRYGGRIIYFLQMLTVVIPTWVLSYATEYWQYLVLGLFIGMAGGILEGGANLCGYSVDKKSNQNGEQVLINMKPGKDKWSGRIYDPNTGSTYDSTIALKGSDSLRVQGCAFGGMFCGGQTWKRVS